LILGGFAGGSITTSKILPQTKHLVISLPTFCRLAQAQHCFNTRFAIRPPENEMKFASLLKINHSWRLILTPHDKKYRANINRQKQKISK